MRKLLLTICLATIGAAFAFAPIAQARELVTLGDADGNGLVDAADAEHISDFAQSMAMPTVEYLCRADIDGDGSITIADSALLLRYIEGLDELPIRESYFTVFVTGNLHGAILDKDPITKQTRSASFLRLFSITERYRAQGQLLLLDAGNSLFGSAETQTFQYLYGNKSVLPASEIFKKLRYDAIFLSPTDYAQGLETLRVQLNALKSAEKTTQANDASTHSVSTVCANFVKVDLTSADKAHTPWNGNLPYLLQTYSVQGRHIAIGIIGMTAAEGLADSDMIGVLGASTETMIDTYSYYAKELRAQCEYTIAMVYAPLEAEESIGGNEENSVRFFVENTESIDFVICAQGQFSDVKTFTNAAGKPVQVVSLDSDGANALVLDFVWDAEDERVNSWAHIASLQDAASAKEDEYAKEILRESEAMFAKQLTTVSEPISRMENAYEDSQWMRFLHDAHIWNVQEWGRVTKADLPARIISISYPYMQMPENISQLSLQMSLRDILQCIQETPSFSLVLLSGSELKAYLQDMANHILEEEPVYSLRGISYTIDAKAAYGSAVTKLSYPDGKLVQDDDIIAVFVAEAGQRGSLLSPYFDSEWLSAENRYLYFSFIVPEGIAVPDGYTAAAPLAYFMSQKSIPAITQNGEWKIVNQ